MDLTRPVTYRGYDLNGVVPQVGKPGLIGSSVDAVDVSTVTVDQYMDKRAQTDGMDFQGVGNLYIGARTVNLRGTFYDDDRYGFFQHLNDLRTLLDPVQCYAADEANEGFLPLAYSEPSGTGTVIAKYILARPEGLHYETNRDRQGTNAKVPGQADAVALGIPWTCAFMTRDPRVYGSPHTVGFTSNTSGTLTNAGDYPTLLDITLVVAGASGSFHLVLGTYDLTISYPAGTNPRTLLYRGRTKLLTVLDTAFSATDEILHQDYLSFAVPNSDTQHPLVLPGANAYTLTASVLAGSQLAFTDAYA